MNNTIKKTLIQELTVVPVGFFHGEISEVMNKYNDLMNKIKKEYPEYDRYYLNAFKDVRMKAYYISRRGAVPDNILEPELLSKPDFVAEAGQQNWISDYILFGEREVPHEEWLAAQPEFSEEEQKILEKRDRQMYNNLKARFEFEESFESDIE
jgi:hypothetical protein